MAARGRRVNRVTIHHKTPEGRNVPTHRIGLVEAERLKDAGAVYDSQEVWYWTKDQLKSPLSPVNLTSSDMSGVVEGRRRSLLRVQNWPVEFNRRSLTIIAGRGAWVPDPTPERIEACSKLAQQASHAKRYAATARN